MYARNGFHIGDAWYYVEGDTVHMFYLTEPNGSEAEIGEHFEIDHAVSTDLRNWEYVGRALSKGNPGAWDDKLLATGSIIKNDNLYWLAYTGHSQRENPTIQRIGMAVSKDMIQWKRISTDPILEVDPMYYEYYGTGQRKPVHWRDPYLFKHDSDIYMYITARCKTGSISVRGTVARAKSRNMISWKTLPPLHHDPICEEMEVPQLLNIDDKYYLKFCTLDHLISNDFKTHHREHIFKSGIYTMMSDSLDGPFRIHTTGDDVNMTNNNENMYAQQIVAYKGSLLMLGTVGLKYISDPIPLIAKPSGLKIAHM